MSKLQTMLLPTGEFILVLSGEAARALAPMDIEYLRKVRPLTGATALFLTYVDDIEVVDALYDENAVRALSETPDPVEEEAAKEEGDDFSSTWFIPKATDSAGRSMTVEFKAKATPKSWAVLGDTGDALIAETLERGGSFSPAGLVKSGQISTATLEPELTLALQEGPGSGAATVEETKGKITDTPADVRLDLDALGEVDDSTAEPREFEPGDRVRILGPSYYGNTKIVGRTGVIQRGERLFRPPGYIFVEVDLPSATREGHNVRAYVARESLELLEEGFEQGDAVEIVGPTVMGADLYVGERGHVQKYQAVGISAGNDHEIVSLDSSGGLVLFPHSSLYRLTEKGRGNG